MKKHPKSAVPDAADASTTEDTEMPPASGPGAESPIAADAPAAAEPVPAGEPADTAALRKEVDALRDRHLRLAAEYDNYRRRTERERAEGGNRAQAQLVGSLLDAVDDLHRVVETDAEKTSAAALLEGVKLVERKLWRALEAAGLEAVDAAGKPFDPTLHEAIAMAPAESEAEDNTVGHVFQTGYGFKGTLLRPARVQVKRHDG